MKKDLYFCSSNPTDQLLACIIKLIKGYTPSKDIDYTCLLDTISCQLTDINNNLSDINTAIHTIVPTVVGGEYPEITEQGIIYHYSGLLSSIVGDILVIFRGLPFGDYQDLPVYLMDNSNYAHIVTNGPNDTPQLIGSEIVVNTQIEAKYIGNYVHLINI